MHIVAAGQSHIGLVREHNEDAFFTDVGLGLFSVCDGVGGAQAGEVASAMTVSRLVTDLRSLQAKLAEAGGPGDEAVLELLLDQFRLSLAGVSEEVFTRALRDRDLQGMSTTAVALAVSGSRAVLAHVGDSRIYLFRKGKLYQLTEDHSLAWELYRQGVLKSSDMATFRYRNVIVRAVGQHPTVNVDTSAVEILPGDTFLLCSDGLTDAVSDDVIGDVLGKLDANGAVARLVDLANEGGGRDNTTVVVVQAFGDGPVEPIMATEEKVLALGRFFLFRDLSFPQTMRILKLVTEVRLDKDETLFSEGDIGGELYLIVSGCLAVTKDGVQLNELSRGKHFGELALISDQVRSASVTALEHSVLLRIGRDAFLEMLREDSVVAAKLLWRFLQETASRVKDLSLSYAEAMKVVEDKE